MARQADRMAPRTSIGMYAHHQGSGHLSRCRTIARALADKGADVTIFTSASLGEYPLVEQSLVNTDRTVEAEQGSAGDGRVTEIGIPLDVASIADVSADGPAAVDASANGTLHWAPLDIPGYTERMTALSAWIAEHRPSAFYVDVSVEVGALVRLLGIPLVTIAMPGERWDIAHQWGYQQASGIIAAWPEEIGVPAHLSAHQDRVYCVGGISRFASNVQSRHQNEVTSRISDPGTSPGNHVVVMQGAGGTQWTRDYWQHIEKLCPNWTFTYLGGEVHSDNPLREMAHADVVVSAAGQNSVADIALSGKPCILLPQERAFAEQFATAEAAEKLDVVLACKQVPDPSDFPALLDAAKVKKPQWKKWEVMGAAERAAEVILDCTKWRIFEKESRK